MSNPVAVMYVNPPGNFKTANWSPAMISVRKQTLYDENQHPVKVLIDYTEWLRIETALGATELEPNGQLLNEFSGKINFGGDPLEIQKATRSEWPD